MFVILRGQEVVATSLQPVNVDWIREAGCEMRVFPSRPEPGTCRDCSHHFPLLVDHVCEGCQRIRDRRREISKRPARAW